MRPTPGAVVDGLNLRANGAASPARVLSTRCLTREAARVAHDLDLHIGGERLRDLVETYVATGHTGDFRTWFIAYADPTGETAVRNVIRQNRARA